MKKIKDILKITMVFCLMVTTSVFALPNRVEIASFTVKSSTKNKVVGKNSYVLAKSASYTADVSAVSGKNPKYFVKAQDDNGGLLVSFGNQTIETKSANLCIRKTFSKPYGFTAKLKFIVNGSSGSITNSAVLD